MEYYEVERKLAEEGFMLLKTATPEGNRYKIQDYDGKIRDAVFTLYEILRFTYSLDGVPED